MVHSAPDFDRADVLGTALLRDREPTSIPSETAHSAKGSARNALRVTFMCLALGVAPIALLMPGQAHSQSITPTAPNAQLLLNADEIIYDNDKQLVIARGNVQLDYDKYNVVADEVTYNQRTSRVTASGNVEILEPGGNRVYADEIDLADNFSEGFVNALRIETSDNTRIAAESAERFEGRTTVFNNGVYTACEPCKERPDRAPIWQVKAQRVIVDGVEKTVTYRNARFEFFGLPIAYFPYFSHADPSVKRKSGFLLPRFGYEEELGFSAQQSYFLVTSDTTDLTVSARGFTRQGVLGEARFRQALNNGYYSIQVAGISQQEPTAFESAPDNLEVDRAMLGTRGQYTINPRWSLGWNALLQSDESFARTYRISGYSSYNITNTAYLTGLHDRSFFNVAVYDFLIQNDTLISNASAFQDTDKQATVHPVLDYNYVTNDSLLGGEVTFDHNVTSLTRTELNQIFPPSGDDRIHGIDGTNTRVSANLGWKKSYATPVGLVLTPSASLYGDLYDVSPNGSSPMSVDSETEARYMPTAALEARYPLLARVGTSSHVIEPTAQFLGRPSLDNQTTFPNEDAQSLVFDTTTLFAQDKFSGYDRIEGGTRLNAGVRYSGVFENGLSLSALVGQSYHLAGKNSFAREDDFTNTGEESGLETDASDIVASFGMAYDPGLSLDTQLRFDDDDFEVRRAETILGYKNDIFSLSVNYTFIDEQPDYAFAFDREQIGYLANIKLTKNWSTFSGVQWDSRSDILISNSAGIAYTDECFTFSLTFSQRRNVKNETSSFVGAKLSLRTIGDLQGSLSGDDIVGLQEQFIY